MVKEDCSLRVSRDGHSRSSSISPTLLVTMFLHLLRSINSNQWHAVFEHARKAAATDFGHNDDDAKRLPSKMKQRLVNDQSAPYRRLSGRHAAAIKSVMNWLQGGRSASVSKALNDLYTCASFHLKFEQYMQILTLAVDLGSVSTRPGTNSAPESIRPRVNSAGSTRPLYFHYG